MQPETVKIITEIVKAGGTPEIVQAVLDEIREERKAVQVAQYVEAMAAFKANPPTIRKDREARYKERVQYTYANLAQVASLIGMGLSAHGFTHSWTTGMKDNMVSVTCTITHKAGHKEACTMMAPSDTSGSKNPVQALGSTEIGRAHV